MEAYRWTWAVSGLPRTIRSMDDLGSMALLEPLPPGLELVRHTEATGPWHRRWPTKRLASDPDSRFHRYSKREDVDAIPRERDHEAASA
jgi:hypothetical protein